ncbi:hypothetical protein [Herbidospora cretacea]|uniref:hypothetical protein n=1 Tax=Herbidospora cretacea TaxID=28444 RepID=UPI0004C2D864|nr:hypothetical protein [Herbidospora cretacea]
MKRILPLLLLVASCPAPGTTYACGGEPVPLAALTGPPATRLGPDGQAALRGSEVRAPDDLEAWHIVEETGDRVALISRLDGALQSHRYLLIERFGPNNGWHMRRSGGCSLRRVFPGLADADLAFGSSSGTRLNLLVTERGCASGQPATGRVELVELEETEQEVRVAVAIRPKYGSATCQGNPPTPFTVELSRTLGDRSVVNAGVHPARRL